MIAYLEGRLEHVSDPSIIVVTDGGVGYEVEITSRQRQSLPERGGRVALYTTLLVREDMLRLCGFATMQERAAFEVLIDIPKVGPRLGLAILSVYAPAELRRIVADNDVTALTVVSGIGKRLAETVCRELAYRLKVDAGADLSGAGGDTGAGSVYQRVLEGLKGLGYSENECAPVIRDIVREKPDMDVSDVLRESLRALGRSR